ncbi:MAG: HdeD family acid-resistance protein, partial [Acidimicrobiales bacterium]
MSEDRSTLDVLRGSRILAYTMGAITLVAGLVLLFWPDRTITVVARLTGILLIVVGLGDLVETFRNHRQGSYWGLLALRGLINLGFGAALLFWPGVTIHVVVWLFGLDLVLTGLLGLVIRGQMPEEYRSAMLTRSILTIVFGLVVMIWPSATLSVIAFAVAALLILFGIVLLWSGYELSKAA